MNWRLPEALFTARNLAWLAGFMLVFWAPFWSGQRLPVLILVGVGIYLHIRGRNWLPQGVAARRWGMLFLLLWVPCLLSTAFSLEPQASYTVCLVLLLHYWAGIALLHGLRERGHVRMGLWIGLTLLFWTLDGAVQQMSGRDLFGVALADDGRVVGPFADNLHMGLFIVVLMPLLLWPLAAKRPWLAVFLIVPMGAIAALAGARTNLVFLLLVAAALGCRLPAWKQRLTLLLLSLSPLLLVPFSPMLAERVLQRDYGALFDRRVVSSPDALFAALNGLSSSRMVIWATAANMVADRPWLGVGPAAFDTAYPKYATRADDPFRIANAEGKHAYHAHQMYVAAAAETGLIGLAGLIAAIALAARWYRQANAAVRQAARPWLTCLAVIAFPINSQPVLFSGWWFPIVLLLLCGMLAALNRDADAPRPAH